MGGVAVLLYPSLIRALGMKLGEKFTLGAGMAVVAEMVEPPQVDSSFTMFYDY